MNFPLCPALACRFSAVAFQYRVCSTLTQNNVLQALVPMYVRSKGGIMADSWPHVFLLKCCALCKLKRAINRAVRKEDK